MQYKRYISLNCIQYSMARIRNIMKNVKKYKAGKNITLGKNVNIHARNVIIEDNVCIGDNVNIYGGDIVISNNVRICDLVSINIIEKLSLGPRSVLNTNFKLNGRDVSIGTEFWGDEYSVIGGGSCFEKHSSLKIGYWCHMGAYSFINTARSVTIGNEVGLGMRTSLFTHGAYLSVLKGFPVQYGPITIGDNCWIPGAIINPNVNIGSNSVIAVGSVVINNIPSGCLAGGIPARIIYKNVYPKRLTNNHINKFMQEFLKSFSEITSDRYSTKYLTKNGNGIVQLNDAVILFSLSKILNHTPKQRFIGISIKDNVKCSTHETFFNIENNLIRGKADDISEHLRNQFRRNGIRFKVTVEDGQYVPW
jgi:acetyltransferase-like isoleucine patch superfamily enzyme